MSDDSMRAKARATFGKEFMNILKPQPLAKNGAVALQKRANARPIPTYKDGGKVDDARIAARVASGNYKKGGKIAKKAIGGVMDQYNGMPAPLQQPSMEQSDMGAGTYPASVPQGMAASGYESGPRQLQQQVSNPNMQAPAYKKGGKVKNGLAVMIAIGKPMKGMKKPVKKAVGGKAEDRGPTTQGQANAAMLRMQGVATKVAPKGATPEEMSAMVKNMSADQKRKSVGVTAYDDRPAARGSAKQALNNFNNRNEVIAGKPIAATPVNAPRPIKKGGAVMKPVKKAVGGTAAATAAPRAPSALLKSLNPQDYQKAQAARAAAATPAAKAAARAKATANIARDAALKTRMSQNAQRAAAQKLNYAASNANIKSGFIGKQAEINKMKAANAAKIAQNNQKRAANATARAANQARQVELNRQAAANNAALAARTPVKRAAGGAAKVRKGQMKGC